MNKEITIGELNEIYQKYGNLGFKVDTPYGFKDIEWCGITEENADVYRCELENGMYVEGADYHKLKQENNEFIHLIEAEVGLPIQTIDGVSKIKSIELMDFKDTLYDIQVAEVHQYYSNGIVSHNTTFTIDALLFLFFGKTTKNEVTSEIFNAFTDKNEVTVGGQIEIDGEEFIIERTLSRKLSKTGEWKVSSNLDFYKILSDGSRENLEGEQRRETDKLIVETIGSYDDFMLTIVATSKNLEDLLETKPTQRGRLLTKFIGLEVIEKKEDINKTLMSDFKSKMKSNHFNTKQLEIDNEEYSKIISDNRISITNNETELTTVDLKISDATTKKENLLGKRYNIEDEIKTVNPILLNGEIEKLTSDGVTLKEKLDGILKEIGELPTITYDEDIHDEIRKEEKSILLEKNTTVSSITHLKNLIDNLVNGEICPTCKRALEEVDHTKEIEENKQKLTELENQLKDIEKRIDDLIGKLGVQTELKKNSDLKDKLNLSKDRTEIEIDRMRIELKEKKTLLKNYEKNVDLIEENRKLESTILGYNQLIETLQTERDTINNKITSLKSDIVVKEEKITENKNTIEQILKEEEVLKIFEVYGKMIGKNGISKLVLSSVIPIINYELGRLMDEVCDFEVELEINDKNEVDFNLIKNNVVKKLRSGSGLETTISSLALRCVLGRISTLPKPNIIVFDEVLGKVANVNLDNVKIFFDKIKKMYEVILLISHNPLVMDWADKIVTVEKNNDISSLQIQ